VVIHDPLYKWALTLAKAQKRQHDGGWVSGWVEHILQAGCVCALACALSCMASGISQHTGSAHPDHMPLVPVLPTCLCMSLLLQLWVTRSSSSGGAQLQQLRARTQGCREMLMHIALCCG
jgi:hypothetical protein